MLRPGWLPSQGVRIVAGEGVMCTATLRGSDFGMPTPTAPSASGRSTLVRPQTPPVASYSLTPEQAGAGCVTTLCTGR